MDSMKKLFCLLLVLIMTLSLCACSEEAKDSDKTIKKQDNFLVLFFVFTLYFLKCLHYVVAKRLAGCAGVTAGDNKLLFFKRTNVERALKLVSLILITDVREKHYRSAEH